jgi:hypothetical protein
VLCGAVSGHVRIGHDYAVTGVPGLGWTICQNKEQNIFRPPLFFILCAWYWRPRRLRSGSASPRYRLAAIGGSLKVGDGIGSVDVI